MGSLLLFSLQILLAFLHRRRGCPSRPKDDAAGADLPFHPRECRAGPSGSEVSDWKSAACRLCFSCRKVSFLSGFSLVFVFQKCGYVLPCSAGISLGFMNSLGFSQLLEHTGLCLLSPLGEFQPLFLRKKCGPVLFLISSPTPGTQGDHLRACQGPLRLFVVPRFPDGNCPSFCLGGDCFFLSFSPWCC